MITNIANHQTKYSLRMLKCTPLTDSQGVQLDNALSFESNNPFVLLHSFIVDKRQNRDRYANLTQGVDNALLYLENHPVVQVAHVAEISSFHIAAGRFYVDDLRPVDGETNIDGDVLNRDDFEQYVFILYCLNS